MRFEGFPIIKSKSYWTKMKQSNSPGLSGFLFKNIYPRNGTMVISRYLPSQSFFLVFLGERDVLWPEGAPGQDPGKGPGALLRALGTGRPLAMSREPNIMARINR